MTEVNSFCSGGRETFLIFTNCYYEQAGEEIKACTLERVRINSGQSTLF